MDKGLTHTSTLVVGEPHLASTVGSGDMAVLATPVMISLMENAAMMAVASSLAPEETTVGSEMTSTHVRPTKLGDTVSAVARLVAIEGRRLEFEVEAADSKGLIGAGRHVRYIVNREKFMSKL
ncbi:MAG: thioesterase family protein [Prevotella sp.]